MAGTNGGLTKCRDLATLSRRGPSAAWSPRGVDDGTRPCGLAGAAMKSCSLAGVIDTA